MAWGMAISTKLGRTQDRKVINVVSIVRKVMKGFSIVRKVMKVVSIVRKAMKVISTKRVIFQIEEKIPVEVCKTTRTNENAITINKGTPLRKEGEKRRKAITKSQGK